MAHDHRFGGTTEYSIITDTLEHDATADPPIDASPPPAPAGSIVASDGPAAVASTTGVVPSAFSEGFVVLVQRELDGLASPADVALLEANERAWLDTLGDLLDDVDDTLERVRVERSDERPLVVADFEAERGVIRDRLRAVRRRVVGDDRTIGDDGSDDELVTSGLQLSWIEEHVVAWTGGPRTHSGNHAEIRVLLGETGAPASGWTEHEPVPLPGGGKADALIANIRDVLGWLVAIGGKAEAEAEAITASLGWIGRVAVLAVDLTARGAVVPQLAQVATPRGQGSGNKATYAVRWVPGLADPRELERLATALPGAATAYDRQADRRDVAQGALADLVDAICNAAALQVTVPAPPPVVKNVSDVAESVLARLDGSTFEAPPRAGGEIARRLEQWARPVTTPTKSTLVVTLAEPDESNAWLLSVFAPSSDGELEPVEVARVTASNTRRKEVRDNLKRLEELLPVLLRPGSQRRGEVLLSQEEAWEVMTVTGQTLQSAGFDVRVPDLSRRKATASLRLSSDDNESVVGAQQLANVRWSAVFDDVELTAEDIRNLAAQAKPLVQSRGRWVELDHADLAEAAAALADRADTTRLTGAEMLRHALGLEGSPLGGGISLDGNGWAADLLASAADMPEELPTKPEGFRGELRSYQAEALAWLSFLDQAGLGGCLALDMGLGKTPTMLAMLRETRGDEPALAVLPPAVLGNWAEEAKKFTPGLKVLVHHGPNRAQGKAIAKAAAKVDVVLTTYGTAVRDVEELSAITWRQLVLDEAQVIKNPASETAQQLRRIEAKMRVALTGTPIENGLGDLWAIMDFVNPGLVGPRAPFIAALSVSGDAKAGAESALKALNGILVFRRTKAEPAIAAELPDRIDELDHCSMTPEQIGLYQAVLDEIVVNNAADDANQKKGQILAAITALKQICNHPVNYRDDDKPLEGRSGKLIRLNEIIDQVFASDEKVLVFTHFASWGEKLAVYLSDRFDKKIDCYHGGLSRGARDDMVDRFQSSEEAGAMVLSLKAGGTGLNLTAASHVVLYDRWWNPAVEDQARDRVWRIGQTKKVIAHRLVCPGTVDERVEEVVAGKRRIADMVLPKSSSIADLDDDQLRAALGLDVDAVLIDDDVLNGVVG